MAKRPTIDSIDASLARWKTKLKRAITTIDKLEKQKKRLLKPRLVQQASKFVANVESVLRKAIETDTPVTPKVADKLKSEAAALDIPEFLRHQSDPAAEQIKQEAEQIREEQAETKRKKARGRIEKLKAKQRGDLKKMPLSGKAALDHIRNG
jgi:CO dehydrogenase/acetyl-CoA synthase beta subunit